MSYLFGVFLGKKKLEQIPPKKREADFPFLMKYLEIIRMCVFDSLVYMIIRTDQIIIRFIGI